MVMEMKSGEPRELNRRPSVDLGQGARLSVALGGGRRFEEQSASRTGKCSSYRGFFRIIL